ncbi:RNA ligase partner protein [Halobacteriales archaeon QS_8_69_26]|nr:MAG: RNA ligase partner protein [Halobacteriales archaeon QS_8_69_26]
MPDHPLGGRFVLDTSALLTEGIRRDGEDLAAALRRVLDLVAEATLSLDVACYVPPAVHDELTGILAAREVPEDVRSTLDNWVVTKTPARHEVAVPAEVVGGFVEELSDRVDRGLDVSEAAVRRADADDPVDRVVADLRDEYRSALRRGLLDSRADFDLLVLARELDACVVTEDTGIVPWAEDFGLRHRRGREFPALLERYLRAAEGDAPTEGTVEQ